MITKYRTGGFRNPIEKVEVIRETASCVFLPFNGFRSRAERKENKRSTYRNYFDTWEEAHEYLLSSAQSELVSARRMLELAQSKVGNIKGIKKPQEAA